MPSRKYVINQIEQYKHIIYNLASNTNFNTNTELESLIKFVDTLNDIISKNDKSFAQLHFKQIQFKFKTESIIDKIIKILFIPFFILLFFVSECGCERITNGEKVGGYYSDLILIISFILLFVYVLTIIVNYLIVNQIKEKKFKSYNSFVYLGHIHKMIKYIKTISKEQFEIISLELAEKKMCELNSNIYYKKRHQAP